jgi:hypothetical protein
MHTRFTPLFAITYCFFFPSKHIKEDFFLLAADDLPSFFVYKDSHFKEETFSFDFPLLLRIRKPVLFKFLYSVRGLFTFGKSKHSPPPKTCTPYNCAPSILTSYILFPQYTTYLHHCKHAYKHAKMSNRGIRCS